MTWANALLGVGTVIWLISVFLLLLVAVAFFDVVLDHFSQGWTEGVAALFVWLVLMTLGVMNMGAFIVVVSGGGV